MSSPHPIPQFFTTRSQALRLTLPDTISSDAPQPLQNHDVPSAARQLTRYHGIIAGFRGGHFAHNLIKGALPIQYLASCDPDPAARSLFQDFLHIPHIFSTSHQLLQWVMSTSNIYIDFFIAHCHKNLIVTRTTPLFTTIFTFYLFT